MKLTQCLLIALAGISYTAGLSKLTKEVEADLVTETQIKVLVQLKTSDLPAINSNSRLSNQVLDVEVGKLNTKLIDHAQTAQTDILKLLTDLEKNGKVSYFKSYHISNTIAVTGTKEVLEQLSKLEEVVEISTNRQFKAPIPERNSRLGNAVPWDGAQPHWSLTFINATNIAEDIKANAAKLRYGNADTGVDFTHPVLSGNYAGNLGNGKFDHNYNWWDANKVARPGQPNAKCGVNSQKPCDDNNHGTHTTSTTVGSKNLGVSPSTKWIACKNMDQNLGSPETYLGCLQFMLAPTDLLGNNPRPELRPHVVGNSYGCPTDEGCSATTFNAALKTLKSAGVFMSVSAGNDGSGGCSTINSPPASDPNSFSVASSAFKSYSRSSFSSLGPVSTRQIAIDVTAPGSSITGAIPGGKYDVLSGTSMASPHVSGAALLIQAACPNIERNVDLIAKVLRESATPAYSKLRCGGDSSTKLPNNEFGYGIINVAKALKLCKTL